MSWQTDVSGWTDKPDSIQVFSDDGREQDYVPERTCEFKPFRGEVERGVCSECSVFMHSQMRYCPNCGARVVYPKK